jgi:hypothetical protein
MSGSVPGGPAGKPAIPPKPDIGGGASVAFNLEIAVVCGSGT